MSTNVLGTKDANAPIEQAPVNNGKDVKNMDYHRQVLQSKIQEPSQKDLVSPSDNIMSPCSAKINALRNKHASKAKPKSLFAQASAKKFRDGDALGEPPAQS